VAKCTAGSQLIGGRPQMTREAIADSIRTADEEMVQLLARSIYESG